MTKTRVDPASVVASITDPELPFLSIVDLGIVRGIEVDGDQVKVTITPTYTACPALETIKEDLRQTLTEAGFEAEIVVSLLPAWTTDDISPKARRLLEEAGIAPPTIEVHCPRCRDDMPRVLSVFGSTACKALMVCGSCGEPFDYFKVLR